MMRCLVLVIGVGNEKVAYDDRWAGPYIPIQSQAAGVLGYRHIDTYGM
jgi:hypothetical protein